MTISAKVVAHSISYQGKEIATLELTYPRFIHSELLTHRMFSRNASSSRAIPVARMIEAIRANPAMPIHWGKNQPGMQAREELPENLRRVAQHDWYLAMEAALEHAEMLHSLGAHKQIVNRLLEPFAHITVLVTATEWDNFFALRLHPDAQPEMQELARVMKAALDASTPELILEDEWHLPYITDAELWDIDEDTALMVSVARCARVSYLTHDGQKPDIVQDLLLFRRLTEAVPMHASPTEHQATPMATDEWSRNFHRWIQFREVLEYEE